MSSGYSQVLKAETSTETIYYVRGFELISRRTGSGASYYLFDGGMSVRGITDEEGNLTDTLVFDAFGNEVERTGTTENSYGFQGEEQDETGLYYLRARYMDPATGTFTSMDTYGGSLEDPMSLHKYLFANSNPVKWCDPSGHSVSLEEAVGVCAIIGALAGMNLYVLGFIHGDDEITFGGLISSAVIGAIIAIVIFFFVYLIVRLVACILLYFSQNPDQVEHVEDKGFETFRELKEYLGSPGEGNQWHHIVEQSQISRSGFANTMIHNVNNIISIPGGSGSIHSHISSFYSSIQPYTDGLRVRDWLAGLSFEEQFQFGIDILSQYGEIIESNEGWIFNAF